MAINSMRSSSSSRTTIIRRKRTLFGLPSGDDTTCEDNTNGGIDDATLTKSGDENNAGMSIISKRGNDDSSPLPTSASSSNNCNSQSAVSSVAEGRIVNTQQRILICLILVFGIIASSIILTIGIQHANSESNDKFEKEAFEMTEAITAASRDYETYSLWVHESCHLVSPEPSVPIEENLARHLGFCSREKFQHLYEHIMSLGLPFVAMQYIPNITNHARDVLELEAKAYYSVHNPIVAAKYIGIKAIEMDSDGNVSSIVRSPEEPFYFPIHYMLPLETNENALEIDLYSFDKELIDKAFETGKPVLSTRARLFQDPRPEVYGVSMVQPGVRTSVDNQTDTSHNAVSKIVIKLVDLIARASRYTFRGLSVYIYDVTPEHAKENDGNPIFLAGADVLQTGELDVKNETKLCKIPKAPTSHRYTATLDVLDHQWQVVIQPNDDRFRAGTSFVILGGAIILIACILLSLLFRSHILRITHLNQIKSKAEAEKAEIAREQARRERYLNDFIAHEVRNPLNSALTALSFAAENSLEHIEDEHVKNSVEGDLRILENSLNYINELLRNMLDIHRTKDEDFKLNCNPTRLVRDLLEPSKAMMRLRGAKSKIDIIVEGDDELIANVDRLRVEQIVLNLGLNASKYVETGFIRLKAEVNPETNTVRLAVEDSGPGIPLGKRDRLFEKYQESFDLLNQGTGVGLLICKNLSQLMNAKIWLDDTYDSGIPGCPGARFVIDLHQPPIYDRISCPTNGQNEGSDNNAIPRPLLVEKKKSTSFPKQMLDFDIENQIVGEESMGTTKLQSLELHESDRSTQSPATETTELLSLDLNESARSTQIPDELPEELSVLFVDDDATLRKLFTRSVKRIAPQWTVKEAPNGETALKLIEEGDTYDAIFVDMYMASIQKQLLGTETVELMRERGVESIICGLSANDTETKFLEAGADDFILKPFPCKKDALRLELLRVLRGSRILCKEMI